MATQVLKVSGLIIKSSQLKRYLTSSLLQIIKPIRGGVQEGGGVMMRRNVQAFGLVQEHILGELFSLPNVYTRLFYV